MCWVRNHKMCAASGFRVYLIKLVHVEVAAIVLVDGAENVVCLQHQCRRVDAHRLGLRVTRGDLATLHIRGVQPRTDGRPTQVLLDCLP